MSQVMYERFLMISLQEMDICLVLGFRQQKINTDWMTMINTDRLKEMMNANNKFLNIILFRNCLLTSFLTKYFIHLLSTTTSQFF